jgi:hypothetical protein
MTPLPDYDSNITEVITTICDFAAAALAHPERKEADELRERLRELVESWKAKAIDYPAISVADSVLMSTYKKCAAALEAAVGERESKKR